MLAQPFRHTEKPSDVRDGTLLTPSQGMPTLPRGDMGASGGSASLAKVPQLTKYQLRSDFQEQVSMDKFGDEIMDQPLGGVTMRKLMAVSNEFNDWVCEHGRRKRRPVEEAMNATEILVASTNAATVGPLYACPSGHARVVLNQEIEISGALLDNGSEVNLMPE